MADCLYCGKPAGLLRRKHKECEIKSDDGWSRMLALVKDSVLGSKLPLDNMIENLENIAKSSFISTKRIQEALIRGWESAVDHFFEDGHLDETEEEQLIKFQEHLSLSQSQLDTQGAYTRLVRGAILRDVMNGIIPDRLNVSGRLPFNLQKTEKLIWVFNDVDYYEDKKRRHYEGRHHGASIRVARGLYYRVGAFKGYPVEKTETAHGGTGLLGITNRHLYFTGGKKSFRIRHDKIVSIQPYSDGVGIQRDAQTATPQLFITKDGWFTYNLLMNVSNL